MIWFSCSKCGKSHGRPENSSGSMVFCECGQGNTVPWESTVAEPPPQPASLSTPEMPRTPTLAPMNFDSSPSLPSRGEVPSRGEDGASRRRRTERRDPNYCLTHTSAPRSATCDDCGEPFCASCLVTMEGATLCGPCKNFRVRSMEVAPKSSSYATFSALIALAAGAAVGFCLLPFGGGTATGVLSMLALLPQMLALGLGIRGLYLSEQPNGLGGQALAITGVTTAAIMVVLTLLLNLYGLRA